MAEKKIHNSMYRANKIPAMQSTVLLFRIKKHFGGLLLAAKGATGDKDFFDSMIDGLNDFMADIDPLELAKLIGDICGLVEVKDSQGVFSPVLYDAQFSESGIAEALKVAFFFVEVNYSDFLDALRPLLLKEKEAQELLQV